MKVIKRGELPSEKIYRAICAYCTSEIEFKASEGKTTHDQRDGSWITVTCPVCGKNVNKSI